MTDDAYRRLLFGKQLQRSSDVEDEFSHMSESDLRNALRQMRRTVDKLQLERDRFVEHIARMARDVYGPDLGASEREFRR